MISPRPYICGFAFSYLLPSLRKHQPPVVNHDKNCSEYRQSLWLRCRPSLRPELTAMSPPRLSGLSLTTPPHLPGRFPSPVRGRLRASPHLTLIAQISCNAALAAISGQHCLCGEARKLAAQNRRDGEAWSHYMWASLPVDAVEDSLATTVAPSTVAAGGGGCAAKRGR
jgi:hypothetical protein